MLVRFLQEWKEYSEGDEAIIGDGIADGLIRSDMAVNIGAKEETVDSSGLKKAKLQGLYAWRTGVQKTLERIDYQIALLEGKEKEVPIKDKTVRRIAVQNK